MKVKISDTEYLEITRVEVVGNLYDENGDPLGDGRYAIGLNAADVESLGAEGVQALADIWAAKESK